MESKEIFKDIPSFEGMYQVSNFGRVRSCNRHDSRGRFRESKEMSLTLLHGYRMVKLSKDGVSKRFAVHRLVAEVFIPNPYNKPFIDHKNANRSDNRVENLRWCTPLENSMFCVNAKRNKPMTNSEKVGAKMVAKLDMNGNELEIYPSIGEAHRQNPKASTSKISAVCRGERNQTAGFKWIFRSNNQYSNIEKVSGVRIPIIFINAYGDRIEYNSIREAHENTKVGYGAIRRSLQKNTPTWDGCQFKYK